MRYDRETLYTIFKSSPEVASILSAEMTRQKTNIELIASENFPSKAVMAACGSAFMAKYTEGYPSNRYYGGCQYYDQLETYCQNKWKEAFKTDYHVNVQPHSGSQANYAAYAAVLQPGNTILAMELQNGGHLTHGSPVNFSGKLYNMVFYGVDDSGRIDYEDFESKIKDYRPSLIVAGASAYSRIIDFKRMSKIIDSCSTPEYRPFFMVDMAHIAGLIVAGEHPTPFGYADIITTTTHKTLRGPRGGMIFCKPALARKIDSAVFPGSQGGPLQNIIAGKAIAAEEACKASYRSYIHRVVVNTKAMADEFIKMGYDVVTGGTDNHLFMLDFSRTHPNLTGLMVQEALDEVRITLNKNCVPNEKRSPKQTSGVRIGCAAMTTLGYNKYDFIRVAHKIDKVIKKLKEKIC